MDWGRWSIYVFERHLGAGDGKERVQDYRVVVTLIVPLPDQEAGLLALKRSIAGMVDFLAHSYTYTHSLTHTHQNVFIYIWF